MFSFETLNLLWGGKGGGGGIGCQLAAKYLGHAWVRDLVIMQSLVN